MSEYRISKFQSCSHSFQWGINFRRAFPVSEFVKFPYSESSHVKITIQIPADDVKICILLDGRFCGPKFISCNFMFLDVEGKVRNSRQATHLFENEEAWEFPTFVKKSHVERYTSSKDFCITLQCDFTVLDGSIVEDIKTKRDLPLAAKNYAFSLDTFAELNENIKRMYADKIHTDIKLKAGTEIFPAHKSILCARSPVFLAMFDNDMAESQKGEVDIPDFDAKTVDLFLGYIYTGTVKDLDYVNAMKLILAADKYQVVLLKNKCAELLESMMTDANVCEILVTADLIRHDTLKSFAFNYIKKQPKKMFNLEEWKHFVKNHFELATETLSEVSRLWGDKAEDQSDNATSLRPSVSASPNPTISGGFSFGGHSLSSGFSFGASIHEKTFL